jgi:alkylation response protein AidB-like acyl-CoA dehydrogenase
MADGPVFGAEHDELRAVVRRFCAERVPESEVRRLAESGTGADPVTWRLMAEQLGLQGLLVPESHGGAGFGYLELVVVLEELGAALACPSLLTTLAAAEAIRIAGDDSVAGAYLPGIAAGETIATLAVDPDPDRTQPLHARRSGTGWVVDGEIAPVADGARADVIVLMAQGPDGPLPLVADGVAAGLDRTPMRVTDQTRPMARLRFDGVTATPLDPAADLAAVLARVAVMVAAEQAGAARRCVETAVEYARTRTQFGRTIGEFQAIQHKCTDMLLDLETTRASVYQAAHLATAGDPGLPAAASLAKAHTADAFLSIAAECIQVHGGIGFTWEHPAHLYYRRAVASAELFGGAALHRELLVRQLGLPA